jgi:hypothetical protein
MVERSVKTDKPFAWQSRRALYRIREKIGGTQAAYAISVYNALTVLASFQAKQTFVATISVIGTHSGLRYKKTHEMIWLLADAGVIAIQENKQPGTKANLPHTFTLLSLRSKRQKETVSNGQDTSCSASETSHADSIKESPAGGDNKYKAPPASSPALPRGSGLDGDAGRSTTTTPAIGGEW